MVRLFLCLHFVLCGGFFLYAQNKTIPFIWLNDSINGKLYEKTALIIPVEVIGDTGVYYFQFDTGANKSYLYKNSGLKLTNESNGNVIVNTNYGSLQFLQSTTNNSFIENGYKVIGTLGADFISKKVIEIDYLNQKLTFIDKYDSTDYCVQPISLSYGRPVLPISINNKTYYFLFDTGSSIFGLWTTKKLWKRWRKENVITNEIPINSWGKTHICYQSQFANELTILDSHISINQLWYSSNRQFKKVFKQANTNGVIGNISFLNNIILIDLKNNFFGVKLSKTP